MLYRVTFKNNNNETLELPALSIGRRQRAQEQIITTEIPYSDEELVEHTGTYLPYERSMDFYVSDETKIGTINSWLTGKGELRTDKEPNGYFKAHVVSGLGYEKLLQVKDAFTVTFKINPPFFYLDSGNNLIKLTKSSTIMNPGTHESKPRIKITGSGNITIDINGVFVTFKSVSGYIVVDSESEYVYKDTANQGDKMTGKFPRLKPGANNIAWTGTVTELEILPRWCEL